MAFRRWRATPDENVWAEVGSVRPDHRSFFHLGEDEEPRVATNLSKYRPYQQPRDISFNHCAVGERQPQSQSGQRFNITNSQEVHKELIPRGRSVSESPRSGRVTSRREARCDVTLPTRARVPVRGGVAIREIPPKSRFRSTPRALRKPHGSVPAHDRCRTS